jgi:threonine aldolase
VLESINPDDVHKARTSLVSLENTSNRGGGSCYEMEEIRKIRAVCDQHNLIFHLDGARLFNALVAKNQQAKDYGSLFHSISICLSKSLGCPVGSLLLGDRDFIKKARRIRKVFGGGMRQAGYLAAAGLFALNHHIDRLQEDHDHAKQIAAALEKKDFVGEIFPVETNIVIFEVKGRYTAETLSAHFKKNNILAIAISKTQVRMVTHLDINRAMIDEVVEIINHL